MMAHDPESIFEKVRGEHGEVEAVKSLIETSKMYVLGFAFLCVILVAGWFGMSIYSDTRVNNCRDQVEDRFWADVGETILQYRLTGSMTDDLVSDMEVHLEGMRDITEVCPAKFWPWDLPGTPDDPALALTRD